MYLNVIIFAIRLSRVKGVQLVGVIIVRDEIRPKCRGGYIPKFNPLHFSWSNEPSQLITTRGQQKQYVKQTKNHLYE
jgi:hypothetical protein